MHIRTDLLPISAGLAVFVLGFAHPAEGGDCGYGCGSLPVPSCYAPPAAVHNHYHCCTTGCCGQCCHREPRGRDRGADRSAGADYRAATPVPIVSSMPVFATPMMMASVPVMPTVATRAAEPTTRSATSSAMDCHERIDRLEEKFVKMSEQMLTLQAMVQDQSNTLREITLHLKKPDEKPNP